MANSNIKTTKLLNHPDLLVSKKAIITSLKFVLYVAADLIVEKRYYDYRKRW